MEISSLPLMILFWTLDIHPGQTQETPTAVLTIKPKPSQIFRGENITLTCDIQGEGQKYEFKCGDGKQYNSKEKEIKITVEFTQMCRCYGCRRSDCFDWSDGVTVTVSDKPRVTVKPQSSVFTGDTVTLNCDVRRSTGLKITWYKNSQIIKSGDETQTLRDVRVSDGGKYRCAVERENKITTQGHIVTLTVRERPKAVLCVQPDGRVSRGETVTLTCDIQETYVTNWTYSWNKDDSEIHVNQSQEYRISSVSESHTGHYSCRGRETGGSRLSHTSDEVTLTLSGSPEPSRSPGTSGSPEPSRSPGTSGSPEPSRSPGTSGSSGSHGLIIGVTVGLSVSFLLIFLLVLLWRYKQNKGGGSPSPSTDHQQHNIRQTEEQKKREQTPQQSDADVTYTEIDLKSVKEMKKKKKENTGKTNDISDTVYSKLKIETE